MSKTHETIPNEPQEAPVQPNKPEIQQPSDPKTPDIPEEAPQNEPPEMPRTPGPETGPAPEGSELDRSEV